MDPKKQRALKRGGLAVTAGAVAAGMSACDDRSIICDPPPPPLCDRFQWDPPLRIEADRVIAALDDTVTFTGKITDDYFGDYFGSDRDVIRDLDEVMVLAPAGTVTDLVPAPPDSFSFRWTPRDEGGGFQPGSHEIAIRLDVQLPDGEGSGPERDRCTVVDSIAVSINAAGTATILRLPAPNDGLGVYFKVAVESVPEGDGMRLHAKTSLTAEEQERAVYEWRAHHGAVVADGEAARFTPDPGATSALVQVVVRLGDQSLAVGTWPWRAAEVRRD